MSLAHKYRPHYTYEDYSQWEGRWELIEGMPYAMSPLPVPDHQDVSGNLYTLFKTSLHKYCKKCKVYLPLDWKVSEDTIVQPDVLIVCKRIEKKYLDFPPSIVVEVLSPATAKKDRGEKLELYQSQKVKYYLIVDLQFKKIEIYTLAESVYGQPSVNPLSFTFMLDDCSSEVNFDEVWE